SFFLSSLSRLHGVKITQRKAENQIKMAKMIMMNELNKRANLLIEQLESISSEFRQRLEDQLQGAIELCSQLEHVQNFITWATAHHRRNPLLFSKELIALQMQQLLEPLMLSEHLTPLKIKFNWDASFWTKQMSTLGQLVVEGGSSSYSEVVGHSTILRPQPVSCIAMAPLCHGVQEPSCAYRSICQPSLCCLHCRTTQTVPLQNYPSQCPQAAQRSSPPILHSCCIGETSVPLHPAGVQPPPQSNFQAGSDTTSQHRTDLDPHGAISQPECELRTISHFGSDCIQVGTSSQSGPDHYQHGSVPPGNLSSSPQLVSLPKPELLQSVTNGNQTLNRGGQKQKPSAGSEMSTDGEMLLTHKQTQLQTTTEPSHPAVHELQPICAHVDDDTRTSVLEMYQLTHDQGEDGQSHSGSKRASRFQGNPRGLSKKLSEDKPVENPQSLTAVTEDRRCVQQNVQLEVPEMMPGHIKGPTMSSMNTYKSEPDNIYAYTYESRRLRTKKRRRKSQEDQHTSDKEATDGSRVPVVCLERLKILVSRHPPQNHQSADVSSLSGFKPALDRECASLGVQAEASLSTTEQQLSPLHLHSSESSSSLEDSQPPLQELSNKNNESGILDVSLNDLVTVFQPDSEKINLKDPPSELRSGSDFQTESTGEAESCSDADAELDLMQDTELQVESESDVISERFPESLSSASEPEFESDQDSTTGVTLDLDPQCEWERDPAVVSPTSASKNVAEAVDSQAEEEIPEIENEDFCAVCLIGGDLLCCDRCPKVFHLACHVPPLHTFPTGDWMCTLCRDVEQPEVEYDCENVQMCTGTMPYGLSACDQRKCEKLTLLILSNILSAPFHEPVSPLARHYYQIIKKPMDLSIIRNRLSRNSHTHYHSPQEFVEDVLLMFKNCAKFNYPDSEVAQAGYSLQGFFISKLNEVFTDLNCPVQDEEESDTEDYEELDRAMVSGFPWPDRKEHSHRKRKRRHSLNRRRINY
ncbi:hypothetical protein DNTS_025713, partial [Danionella cerebrum]